MPTIGFRLAVRNAADTADEYIFTSVPGIDTPTTHPVLTEPPSVDGSSADLIAGTCDVGSATVRFWDEWTTVTLLTTDVLLDEDWESYADLTALDAAWPETISGTPAGTATWSVATTEVDEGSQALGLALAGYGAAFSEQYRSTTLTGLPSGTYRVSVPVWADVLGDLSGASFDTFVGLAVHASSADSVSRYEVAAAGTAGEYRTLTIDQFVSGGTLAVKLIVWSFGGAPATRNVRWGTVRVTAPGTVDTTGRVMTARLHTVQDAVARLAPLSRRARIEQSVDGGAWAPYHRGYLNRLECDGGEWTVTVGDTTRREQQTELFATLPTLDPASLADPLPIPLPRVGLILGGPIAADATYGTFAGIADYGPTRWKVEAVYTDPEDEFRTVRLKFVAGYLRPWYYASRARFDEDEWTQMNVLGRPYFQWDPVSYQSVPSATVNHFGYFPDLRARLDPVGAGDVVEKMPLARLVKHEPGDKEAPKAEYDALVGNDSVIYVDWTNDAAAAPFPAVNAEYDVTMYSAVISDSNPLLLAGHPVDLVAYAAALSDVPWNAASRTDARAALGDGLWCDLKITGAQKFSEFQKSLGGFFGFLFRPDAATGERHFVPTRVRPASPAFAITNADRIGGGDDGSLPPVWAAEEDSVVNVVKFATLRFRFFRYKEDSGDPPITMLAEAKAEVEGHRGDTTVNGERTQTYDLPGQLQRRAADGRVSPLILVTRDEANPGYAEQAGGVIVDFAGWGIPQTVVVVDAESAAAAAQLGDEGTLDLPDLPFPDAAELPVTARGVDRAHTPRVVRVVKVDPQVGAVQLTLVHAGELSQDAVAEPATGGTTDAGTPELPTLGLAASTSAPTTVVTVTLTNGADLSADNLRTELEYLTQAGTPAGTDEGTEFGPVTAYPDGDLTTIDTPSVAPGSVVWVRARSVNVATNVASAWTTWASVTLAPIENGGSTPGETPYAPTLSVSAVVDPATGDVTATANASASAVSVKFAIGPVGGAPPSLADVRAATPDSSAPFASGTLATLTAGQVRTVGALAYDAVGNESAMATDKVARESGAGATALDDLSDVDAPAPADGDVLTWDGTANAWVPVAPTGGGGALVDLTDVDDTGLDDGDVPTWDAIAGAFKMAPPIDLTGSGLPSDVLRTGAGTATTVWPGESWPVTPLTDAGPFGASTIDSADPQGPTWKSLGFPAGRAELFSVRIATAGTLKATATTTNSTVPFVRIWSAAGVLLATHGTTEGTGAWSAEVSATANTEYLIEIFQGNNGQVTSYTMVLTGTATIDDSPSVPPNLAAISPPFTALVDGATITWGTNARPVVNAYVTLGGNRTLSITGAPNGQQGTLIVTQDATGSRTLTLPSGSLKSGWSALSTAANAIDMLEYRYNGTNYLWTLKPAFA